MGIAFIVFGGIFLVMAIIIFFVMKKTVYNPNCGEEIMAVYTTKRNWLIFFIISLLLILTGLIIIIL
jgi:uncharacterized membrane protein